MSFNTVFNRFIVLGHHPYDTEDEKLRKSSLLTMSAPFALAGLIWGLLYFLNGLTIPGLIPFSYAILSIASIIHFARTTRYKVFRTSQLLLILILPFALQLSLGGYIASSAVIMWALVSPAGALIFFTKRQSLIWFSAYILLVVIAFLVNEELPNYFNWHLTEGFINALFLMNIIGISSIIFLIQYYFVGKQYELKRSLEEKSMALEEQAHQLKEMDEIKSRFFANISHEFRTPLTLILGLLKKQIDQPNVPPALQDSNTMKRNAQRLLQLINQLLDLSKLESGEIHLEVAQGDLSIFVKKMVMLFESLAQDKYIDITYNGKSLTEHKAEEPIMVYFDHEKIQKVLANLISNAIKFTPAHGIIELEAVEKDNHVNIVISNSGEGIPKEQMHRIFDRFYQVDTGSTRPYDGTGIGLALVKELMVLHRGSVQVESTSERTSFTITLPLGLENLKDRNIVVLASANATEESIYEESKVDNISLVRDVHDLNSISDDHRLVILIVEDNDDLRAYIKSILKKGYKVLEATDGVDGLEIAERSIPDLIISDVMMPKMDGYELCRQLKSNKNTNHIPVVLLTAKASRENKLEGLETGADDYLVKPFDQEELEVRIKNLISIREQLQKKYKQEVWLKPKEVKISSVHQKFLEQVKEIIEQHIDNSQFSVEDLGAAIAMSRSQVHRKLKALTELSATAFIRNYRLHRAADLLKLEAGNVTEIAYQVGFSSQTYFSTCFQEVFGCSPSEYRASTVQ